MGFSKTHSAQIHLLDAHIIDIETDISRGLFSFSVVGLPDKAVEESRDRVSAALKNSGFESPKSLNHKIVVSLAPADLKKEGPAFDLAIALGYLLAAETISFDTKNKLFLGELSLDGLVRPIQGTLPLVAEAAKKGFTEVFVPKENATEAALVKGVSIIPVQTLSELIHHITGKKIIASVPQTQLSSSKSEERVDLGDIAGNEHAKRAAIIGASGGHNMLFYGPPGTGKTMIARAIGSLLPPLELDEALEVTAIHSVAGILKDSYVSLAPIRSPHHTSSYVALVGGGSIPKPGEATLAHRGVLFLDELPEFDRRVVEALREPLEEGHVSVSRARGSARFPAQFMLIGAMNPCPCGNFGVPGKRCVCTPTSILRYQKKISGPLMDRIDIFVEIAEVDHRGVISHKRNESEGVDAKIIVKNARKKQLQRQGKLNSGLSSRGLKQTIQIEENAENILVESAKKLDLSARACHRIMRLSRTIADLAESETVKQEHILEALQYRKKKES